MNFLFAGVEIDVQNRLMLNLVDHYRPENISIMARSNLFEFYREKKIKATNSIGDSRIVEVYDRVRIGSGDYKDYIFYNDCPPIGHKLLKSISEYDSIIMKVLERTEKWGYDERIAIYDRHLRYLNYMLEAAEIDVVVLFYVPHNPLGIVLYYLCKLKNIAIVFFTEFSIFGLCSFASDFTSPNPMLAGVYAQLAKELKGTPIDEINIEPLYLQEQYTKLADKDNDKTPVYMQQAYRKKLPVEIQALRSEKSGIINQIKKVPEKVKDKGLIYISTAVKEVFRRTIKSVFGYDFAMRPIKRLQKVYESLTVHPDYTRKYIYFPLHYQPEATTNPLGGVFAYQERAIKMLSFYLPSDCLIYVKEHPMQGAQCRDVQLYRDLVELPNAKLVPLSTDTYKLIEHSIAVASITGTAGFEGLMVGKPYLMFGYQIYMYAPGTFNIRNNEDCKEAIEHIMKYGAKHTLKDMKIWFKALGQVTQHCCQTIDPYHLEHLGLTGITAEENARRLTEGYIKVFDKQLGNERS